MNHKPITTGIWQHRLHCAFQVIALCPAFALLTFVIGRQLSFTASGPHSCLASLQKATQRQNALCIIRCRIVRMHEIRTIATDVLVAWCASLSLSVTRLRPAKRLNGTTSCLEWRLLGAQETLYDGVAIPLRRGEEKRGNDMMPIVSLYTATTHSHSSDGATFDAAIAKLLKLLNASGLSHSYTWPYDRLARFVRMNFCRKK